MERKDRASPSCFTEPLQSIMSSAFLLQTSPEEGKETAPSGMTDDRGKHLLSSVRGSSANKQTIEDMKIDLLLLSPTGTSHGGSRPLFGCAVMTGHS